MTAIVSTITIMRYAFRAGLSDYRAMYTWRSWLAGWFVRVLAQVSFFALIGERLGSDEQTTFYLLVGNALAVAAVTGVFSLNMTSSERWAGTLPLLVASPSSPLLVFGSRGSYLAIDGAFSALSALFVAGPLFGMELPWPRVLLVVPLTMLVAYTCYCFGTFLAGIVFRFRNINSFVVLTSYMTIMAVCGVNVPLTYYPEALEWISRFSAADERAARDPGRPRRSRCERDSRRRDARGRRRPRVDDRGASELQPARLARPARRLARLRSVRLRRRARRPSRGGTRGRAEGRSSVSL